MTDRTPPRIAAWLIRLRHSQATAEFLLGDLAEEFADGRSRRWYWRQAASLLWSAGQHLEERREAPMGGILSGLPNDIRYAWRTLSGSPGMTAIAVTAIALGIGVNTGIFTLLNAYALRPMPVSDAGDVVTVYQIFRNSHGRTTHGATPMLSYPEFEKYRAENHVFSGMAAYHFAPATIAGETPQGLLGFLVSCDYFSVLGEQPRLGRGFRTEECRTLGAGPVVVLSDNLWKGQFSGDTNIIGKSVILNREHLTVVGVAPPGFQGTDPIAANFWAPISMADKLDQPGDFENANLSWLMVLGRRKSGVSLDQVRADLAVIAGRLDHMNAGMSRTLDIHSATFHSNPYFRKQVLSIASVVLAAVGLVLLIACANVANLLLAKASARRKEIALRLSLGAGRGRVIRQLLTESLMLSLAGGVAGSLAAFWGCAAAYRWINGTLPSNVIPLALNVTPDLNVLGYALLLTLATGVLFGLAPALQATKPDLNAALKDEGAGSGASHSGGWLRSALVAAQVSVCLILMIAAGLLARGLQAAQAADPGFQSNGVVTASFDLRGQHYRPEMAEAFHRRLAEHLSALPGVDSVAQAAVVPLSDVSNFSRIEVPGTAPLDDANYNSVSPSYFSTLAIPIVHGRNFRNGEGFHGAKVAIVSEGAAMHLWPKQEPLGKTFRRDGMIYEVIGIARDSLTDDLAASARYYFYFPIDPKDSDNLNVLMHSNTGTAAAAKAIRAAAREIDPNLITNTQPLEENLTTMRWPSRMVTLLSTALGLLALILSSIGIYGVVSYAVSRRRREIGIRVALGAGPANVVRLMVQGALRPVVLGAAIGIVACAAVSRVFSSVLFGVSPLDPVAFVGVTIFLLGIALLASYLPARRAARVDPIEALRHG